nr:MAG TPA: hypothetical protein [Caudoviricetes sp.]
MVIEKAPCGCMVLLKQAIINYVFALNVPRLRNSYGTPIASATARP